MTIRLKYHCRGKQIFKSFSKEKINIYFKLKIRLHVICGNMKGRGKKSGGQLWLYHWSDIVMAYFYAKLSKPFLCE